MATSAEYAALVCDRVAEYGTVQSRKMFGEYMVYLRKNRFGFSATLQYLSKNTRTFLTSRGAECDIPYPGAKEHYILDIENRELPDQVIPLPVAATPPPKDKQRGGLHSTEQSRGQRPRLVFAVSGREKGEKEKESEDVTKKSN